MRTLIAVISVCWCIVAFNRAVAAEDDCSIPAGIHFLPTTAAPTNRLPATPAGDQFPNDCDFYRWAWQTFLYSTDRIKGRPRFLQYQTFEDIFHVPQSPLFAQSKANVLSLAPRTAQSANSAKPAPVDMTALEQALSEKVLIDLRGYPIWYQINLNSTFSDVISANELAKLDTLKLIPLDLEFRTGSVEFKSAWQIIDKPNANFITTQAVIPVFKTNQQGKVTRDGDKTREVTVGLIALHVVGVIDGHPEFVWATFEHTSSAKGGRGLRIRDVAPSADSPDQKNQKVINEGVPYLLYPGTTKGASGPLSNSNDSKRLVDLSLDATTQKFAPTSAIFRIFPASQQKGVEEDGAVVSINKYVQKKFEDLANNDVRRNYTLVGAVWLNKPREDFQANKSFPPNQGSFMNFGGEDGLSSMAMESFTQSDAPNCFSCHDTNPNGPSGLAASRLNVSHVLSKFFLTTKK